MYTAHILVMPTGKYLLFLFFVINIKTHLSKNNINCCWSLESRYQEKWKKKGKKERVRDYPIFHSKKHKICFFIKKQTKNGIFIYNLILWRW